MTREDLDKMRRALESRPGCPVALGPMSPDEGKTVIDLLSAAVNIATLLCATQTLYETSEAMFAAEWDAIRGPVADLIYAALAFGADS